MNTKELEQKYAPYRSTRYIHIDRLENYMISVVGLLGSVYRTHLKHGLDKVDNLSMNAVMVFTTMRRRYRLYNKMHEAIYEIELEMYKHLSTQFRHGDRNVPRELLKQYFHTKSMILQATLMLTFGERFGKILKNSPVEQVVLSIRKTKSVRKKLELFHQYEEQVLFGEHFRKLIKPIIYTAYTTTLKKWTLPQCRLYESDIGNSVKLNRRGNLKIFDRFGFSDKGYQHARGSPVVLGKIGSIINRKYYPKVASINGTPRKLRVDSFMNRVVEVENTEITSQSPGILEQLENGSVSTQRSAIVIGWINIVDMAWEEGGHANLIIVDNTRRRVYRYEPHGTLNLEYDQRSLDRYLEDFVHHHLGRDYSYNSPRNYQLSDGIQARIEVWLGVGRSSKLDAGYCVTHCASFAWIVANYPTMDPSLWDKVQCFGTPIDCLERTRRMASWMVSNNNYRILQSL